MCVRVNIPGTGAKSIGRTRDFLPSVNLRQLRADIGQAIGANPKPIPRFPGMVGKKYPGQSRKSPLLPLSCEKIGWGLFPVIPADPGSTSGAGVGIQSAPSGIPAFNPADGGSGPRFSPG